ncbi:MAG: hypothetical protein Q4D61_06480 [Cardiobacteriaceae bacterium]|nr:hypothetical protein [Cardiobacteriaceae bacterium]
MKPEGNISIFLQCLGLYQGNSKILDAYATLACDFQIDQFEIEEKSRESWNFFPRGGQFYFVESRLIAFFFYIKEKDEFRKYPFLAELIHGIHNQSTHKNIKDIIGTPEKEGDSPNGSYLRYQYEEKYIHFEFDKKNELSLITLFINTD